MRVLSRKNASAIYVRIHERLSNSPATSLAAATSRNDPQKSNKTEEIQINRRTLNYIRNFDPKSDPEQLGNRKMPLKVRREMNRDHF